MSESNSMETFEREDLLSEYLQTVLRYKWRILLLSLASCALTLVILSFIKPLYSATTTLVIEPEIAKLPSIDEIYGMDVNKTEYYLTQFEILKSRQLASRVIDKLDLLILEEFQPSIDIQQGLTQSMSFADQVAALRNYAIDVFVENLTVVPVLKTQMVKLSYRSSDRKLAVKIVDTIANEYVASYLESKTATTETRIQWMNTRLEETKRKLTDATEALNQYVKDENLIELANGIKSLSEQKIEALNREIADLEGRRLTLFDDYKTITGNNNSIEILESLSRVNQDKNVLKAKELLQKSDLKMQEITKRYGPKHPTYKMAKQELEAANAHYNSAIQVVIKSIRNNYQAIVNQKRELELNLKNAKQEFQSLTRKESQYSTLQREVESNQELYDAYLKRIKDLSEVKNFKTSIAKVVDAATEPTEPVFPKKGLTLGFVFVISLMVGVILSLLSEAINEKIRDKTYVENVLKLPFHGAIMKSLSELPLSPYLYFDKKYKDFSEQVRNIRTSFLLSQIEKDTKVIGCISPKSGDGKSTIAISLAQSFGQLERVLLVDANLRTPTLGKAFGLEKKEVGLTHCIAQNLDIERAIYRDIENRIDVLMTNSEAPNPQEVLASKKFNAILNKLKQKYDRIIIDTSSIQDTSDALVAAQVADVNILIVNATNTSIRLAKDVKRKLSHLKINVSGVVINKAKSSNLIG